MQLIDLNACNSVERPLRPVKRKIRRLTQVIGNHVDQSLPFVIAIQDPRDKNRTFAETLVQRGRDKAGKVKPWPRMYLPADATVVVVYLPRGSGGGTGGRSGSSKGLSIALSIATVALVAFGQPYAVGLLGAAAGNAAIAGGVIGIQALSSLASCTMLQQKEHHPAPALSPLETERYVSLECPFTS